jgi:hypothetical protein
VNSRLRGHLRISAPTARLGAGVPAPPTPGIEERFRAFLGIIIGIAAGAVLWLALIQLIRKLI